MSQASLSELINFYTPWNHQENIDPLGKYKSIKRLEFLKFVLFQK